ncbi:hypothetical protein SBADM41S_09063 [Streptomyces badius]
MSGRSIVPRALPRTVHVLAALALATALTAGCADATAARHRGRRGGDGLVRGARPSAASPFWVDPDSDAARQVRAWEKEGRDAEAKTLRRISERPVADWPAWDDPAPGIRAAVRSAARTKKTVGACWCTTSRTATAAGTPRAARRTRTPTVPGSGSSRAPSGTPPTIVILEPDALPHIADGCTPPEHHTERYQLLSEAVDTLKALPNTKVYLDAGNPDWIDEPAKMAQPLREAGVERADWLLPERLQLPVERQREDVRRAALRRGGRLALSSTPAATATAPCPGAVRKPGAIRRAGGSARPRPPTPATSDSTPICGSSGRATPTAPAAAARRPATGGRSTRSASPGAPPPDPGSPAPGDDRLPAPEKRPSGVRPPLRELLPAVPRQPTLTHFASEGMPSVSVTKSMYQPGGTRVGSSGTVTPSLPPAFFSPSSMERCSTSVV